MNFFICNRYDSKREKIYILTPNNSLNKDNLNLLKYPFLRSMLSEDINNINLKDYSINNISKNSDNSEINIIDYPYVNTNIGHQLANKFKNGNHKSYYNCLNTDNDDENNQIKINNKKNQININNKIYSELKNSNFKLKNKLKLNDSEIDVEDTIKGEDNINISKLKQIKINFGVKNQNNNIKKVSNKIYKKGKIKSFNKNSLNELNINNISNDIKNIPSNKKINITNSKIKLTNKTSNFNNKPKINLKIKENNILNITSKTDKNKSKNNITKEINLNDSKKQKRLILKNNSDYNIPISSYEQKVIYNTNNSNYNDKKKKIINSIKKKMQKGINNFKDNNIKKFQKYNNNI